MKTKKSLISRHQPSRGQERFLDKQPNQSHNQNAHPMKTLGFNPLPATVLVLALFALHGDTRAAQEHAADIQVQGRPLSTWAAELGYGEREGHEQAIAVLVCADPKIITNLADLLLHSTSSREQAGAVLAIGAIAYQNPAAAPALTAAIPALASAVDNHDPGVRVLSIQGLVTRFHFCCA